MHKKFQNRFIQFLIVVSFFCLGADRPFIELPSIKQNSKSLVSVSEANERFGVGQEKLNNNLISIEEIYQKGITGGTYHIQGYVAKIYRCPPCPPEAACKPCMSDNIVVSQEKKAVDTYEELTEQDLIVFVDDPTPFEVGKKYQFLIQILDVKTANKKVNNVKLIYFEDLTGGPVYQEFSIKELNHLASGTFYTTGYAVLIDKCPPCPRGAQCEPCPPDSVVLSEVNKEWELIDPMVYSEEDLVVFIGDGKKCDLKQDGGRYKLLVKIMENKFYHVGVNNAELMECQRIE